MFQWKLANRFPPRCASYSYNSQETCSWTKYLAVSSWYSTSPTSWSVPPRELTYPPDVWHFWVDDFPNFPRWYMLVSWSFFFAIPTGPFMMMFTKLAFSSSRFKSLKVAIGELEIIAVQQLLSRDGIGTIFKESSFGWVHFHRIHVWYIYLHLP